jgi:hypothetical protein
LYLIPGYERTNVNTLSKNPLPQLLINLFLAENLQIEDFLGAEMERFA